MILVDEIEHAPSSEKTKFELTPAAQELLFREGYDAVYRARPLKRAIQQLIQDPLAMRILEEEVLPGDCVIVDADSRAGAMKFTRKAAQEELSSV